MLDCQKHLFSLPDSVHYLNCAYMSPLLKSVEQAGIEGITKKRHPFTITTDDFFSLPNKTRTLFAELIHADSPESITLLPSVSYGMAIVAKNLQAKAGQNIVSVSGEFPSNVYAWKSFVNQGVELRLIAPPDIPVNYSQVAGFHKRKSQTGEFDLDKKTRGEAWNEAILEAIDENTALVVLCPIHWADGTFFDLEVIGDAARTVGAMLVIDGTQAIGAMPFDIPNVKPDALIAASYKCMMGPYSIGCAYWGERFREAIPLEETWIGRLGSDNFRNLVQYQEQYQTGHYRLNVGEFGNFALVPMLNVALQQLIEWQPLRIQEYCTRLIRPLVDFCRENQFWIEESQWRADHLFGIRIKEQMSVDTLQHLLQKKNVYVSLRGNSIRISPSVYNNSKDIEALISVLQETLGK